MERQHFWLVLPCLAFLVVMYVLPALLMFWTPFETGTQQGVAAFVGAFANPGYQRVMGNTFETSLMVTVGCIILGYPTAYYLSRIKQNRARLYLLLVMFPLWTSLLVRTYAWIALLQDAGIVNSFMMSNGMVEKPVKMLYNQTSVVIGMIQILFPYAIVTMYAVMVGIKPRLVQTAQILGANPRRAFLHVFLPLSLPGLSSATLLIFIMGLGFFVTPALLGGRRQTMIGTLIQQQVVLLGDWISASMLSVILLTATLLLLIIYSRFARLGTLVPSRA
ncbi:ABC transporter permease [Rhizobium pusense]|uniref:ABC transporter permease n=1 Tax=Agrobacterium pusense TaxID=648995 RepID=UPI00244C5D79|nr:ABC transporter permease [Agrobacterium pusense]MDH2091395.1 ABC transporter permease [Agrobacterium pusense]